MASTNNKTLATDGLIIAVSHLGLDDSAIEKILGLQSSRSCHCGAMRLFGNLSDKQLEIGYMLIRLSDSLLKLSGHDTGLARRWLNTKHPTLGGEPAHLIEHIHGLNKVLDHLEACQSLKHSGHREFGYAVLDYLSIGIVLLDQSLSITFLNIHASEVLQQSPHVRIIIDKLALTDVKKNLALQQTLQRMRSQRDHKNSSYGTVLTIDEANPQTSITIFIRQIAAVDDSFLSPPSQPGLALFLITHSDRAVPSSVLKVVFSLTPMQAMLCEALLSGNSLKEAAEELGIRFETARSHLKAVFQRTGARRQSDLVKMLSSVCTVIRHN